MKSQYKIIFIISFLLVFLSLGLSIVNYTLSLYKAEDYLERSSLPLSTDNIYSEIQTHLIKPNIVASMMAQDTFLKDWLVHNEEDEKSIQKYLESIKEQYQMYTVFLASEKTKHYYSSKGFVEEMNTQKPINAWYYRFKEVVANYEVNIDYNKHVDNSMIMFINHKIFDANSNLLGITGVGLKASYIDAMLKRFRQDYNFKVCFVDKEGLIVMQEKGHKEFTSIEENGVINKYKDQILSGSKHTLRYEGKSSKYLLHSKYIPELDLYLLVQAKMSDFTAEVRKTFYLNLILSFLVTFGIIITVVQMVRKHTKKLEDIASHDELTKLHNRRSFKTKLDELLLHKKRKSFELCLLFFDLDDFKNVNDSFGHEMGDKVLVRVAEIIKNVVRVTDFIGRWGGEEFIVTFADSSLKNTQEVAEKLRVSIEEDKELYALLSYKLTASFGLTSIGKHESLNGLVKRVDDALYKAKNEGKNRVVIA